MIRPTSLLVAFSLLTLAATASDVTMEGQAVDPGLFNGEHYFKLEPNPGTALIFHLGGDLLGTPGASAQALARRGDEARFRRDE